MILGSGVLTQISKSKDLLPDNLVGPTSNIVTNAELYRQFNYPYQSMDLSLRNIVPNKGHDILFCLFLT